MKPSQTAKKPQIVMVSPICPLGAPQETTSPKKIKDYTNRTAFPVRLKNADWKSRAFGPKNKKQKFYMS
jgi:hypothetical protein